MKHLERFLKHRKVLDLWERHREAMDAQRRAGRKTIRIDPELSAAMVDYLEDLQRIMLEAQADPEVKRELEEAGFQVYVELVFVDDTRMKILNVERGDRKSTQTTAIVARRGAHWIHLYQTGTRHAGDNLERLFASRSPGLPPPIQMSDALACNTSHGIVSLIAFCLMHARRKFFEIQDYFPDIGSAPNL